MSGPLLAPARPCRDGFLPLELPEIGLAIYPEGRSLPPGIDLAAVTADLMPGMWIARYQSPGPETFRIGGTRFELRVRRKLGKNRQQPIAVVVGIDEARSMPRRADHVVAREVFFQYIYDEPHCDLEEILEASRRHRGVMSRERRTGVNGPPGLRALGRLQRDVESQYGDLRALFEILEQRPDTAEQTVSGVVVDASQRRSDTDAVRIATSATPEALTEFDRRRVRVRDARGLSINTHVLRVKGQHLELREPRRWPFRVDAKVFVDVLRPFAMRQNAQALTSFLRRDVEGSWENLARLLCRPASLDIPTTLDAPEHFFCDDDPLAVPLNDEQRLAVAGAVSSPHAFFVQGPPGTGKTEVICEVIRQLTGRGERVLMLAPSHVAVDEVLGRIGRKPGIRALRITWDDDRVEGSLHDFLEANIGSELLGQVLRPEDGGQHARWSRELDKIDTKIQTSERAQTLLANKRRRETIVAQLRVSLAASQARRERTRVDSDAAITALRAADARADEAVAAAHELLIRCIARNQELTEQVVPVLTPLPRFAEEWRGRAAALDDATAASTSAAARAQRIVADLEQQLDDAYRDHATIRSRIAANQAMLAQRENDASAARTALEEAIAHQSDLGRLLGSVKIGPVASARRRLAGHERDAWALKLDATALEQAAAAAQSRIASIQHLQATSGAAAVATAERADTARAGAHAGAEAAWTQLAVAGDAAGATLSSVADRAARERMATYLVEAVYAAFAPVPRSIPLPADTPGLDAVATLISDLVESFEDRRAARERHRAAEDDHARTTRDLELGHSAAEAAQHEVSEACAKAERQLDAVIRLLAEMDAELATLPDDAVISGEVMVQLTRRRRVLSRLPALHERWCELTKRSDDQIGLEIRESLVKGANLICATTKGIVGRGSDVVRHADYDTLIVDEASRVTETEFLIGAVRARRWVLVGDEHQLPPHVEVRDEHFLHALTALHRTERGASDTLENAVKELSQLWSQDEELHQFREQSVLEVANELVDSGTWAATFRAPFAAVHQRFTNIRPGHDADHELLKAILRQLVQSLFQKVVATGLPQLRQELVWQRRMIEPLARIVNQPVYNGRYRTPDAAELARNGVTPLVLNETLTRPVVFVDTSAFRDADDELRDHGFVNRREQDLVARICQRYNDGLTASGAPPITVSILAFYRAQAQALQQRVSTLQLPKLQLEVIDVIDRIQGQQADLVILSFTRARTRGRIGPNYGLWLQDIRRLNVAFTRARRAIVLVGHDKTLRGLGTPVAGGDPSPARRFYDNLFHLIDNNDTDFMRIRRI